MSAPTLADLIADAYYETGVYSPGETINPKHVTFGGVRLNSMIDSWKVERLTIYREQRTGPFLLVVGTQTYTIGSGAVWDTPRPIWIDFAGLVQTVQANNPIPEYPMTVMTDYEWAKTVTKTLQSTIPTALWYDRTFTSSGYGTIYIWPVPTVANYVALYSPVPVNEFDVVNDINTAISFPPGYRDFLMYHLAMRLAPTFGKRMSEISLGLANLAMEKVKNANLRLNTLRVDDAIVRKEGGFYNYLNDSFDYR